MQLDFENQFLDGLSSIEAKKRLQKFGYNEIVVNKKKSKFKIFLSQFNDFIVWVLIAATVISGIMGEKADAITIIAIILLDAILGFIQEYRTEKSLEALKKLSAPTAKVMRDGKISIVNAGEVVIGDLIEVEAGDRVPADAIIIKSEAIKCDESILTGESVSVEKKSYNGKTALKENYLYMGCTVTNGKALAKVIATGMNTEMGKIANMLQSIDEMRTPLQERLDNLGQYLVYVCLIVCGIVTVTGVLRGENIYDMFLIGVSLAVAAIPEGLPAIVTVSLALGVQRMVRKNALVKKLPAVETLGCTNVICSDKTGTLTQNRMTVKKVVLYNKEIDITGDGYEFKGDFFINGIKKNIDSIMDSNLHKLLDACILCNNSYYILDRKKINFYGDPTEIALLVLAEKAKLSREKYKNTYKRIKEIPFDSDRKMMSVVVSDGKNKIMYTKGAVESIIKACSYIEINNKVVPLDLNYKRRIIEQNENMAKNALRVIAFAYKNNESNFIEKDLVFLGLVGMMDPPRREVLYSVQECRAAGIKPVMITGDHKLTAEAIAKEIQIINSNELVLTGDELDNLSDEKLVQNIDKIAVFARVRPEHKYRIVKAYKSKGYIVAMTGDGVNDAPAVKEADIGIAMGIQGTDVTKEAAAMILMDDNFSTIVEAVREGRVIYDNIRKFIRYLLSCNIGEILTMFLATILKLPVPLIPIQILLVNLATDGLPAMALSLEGAENDVMFRKPRNRKESIFSEGLLFKILNRGALIGICTILSFVYTLVKYDSDIVLARTVALSTLIMSQLFHVFECRSERQSIFNLGIFTNVYLVWAVLTSFVMLIIVVYIPMFQTIFKTKSLNLWQWIIVFICSGLISIISSIINYKRG
ncbi:calcium-translocating P-type ATPase, SERCA-type [Caloramator sp. ALD01]|uniref:Ca2+-transporting ATPase n=1 Tax=Caloramator proteoclasticus DSM 10124 TaxID=1121262 RepID=A0A1M4TCZ0_9CLOT|nr:Ca2+-transporting ATPase [Caloramator proteoclasticus DSM 10124]